MTCVVHQIRIREYECQTWFSSAPHQLRTYVERVGFKEIDLTTEYLVQELAPPEESSNPQQPQHVQEMNFYCIIQWASGDFTAT